MHRRHWKLLVIAMVITIVVGTITRPDYPQAVRPPDSGYVIDCKKPDAIARDFEVTNVSKVHISASASSVLANCRYQVLTNQTLSFNLVVKAFQRKSVQRAEQVLLELGEPSDFGCPPRVSCPINLRYDKLEQNPAKTMVVIRDANPEPLVDGGPSVLHRLDIQQGKIVCEVIVERFGPVETRLFHATEEEAQDLAEDTCRRVADAIA